MQRLYPILGKGGDGFLNPISVSNPDGVNYLYSVVINLMPEMI